MPLPSMEPRTSRLLRQRSSHQWRTQDYCKRGCGPPLIPLLLPPDLSSLGLGRGYFFGKSRMCQYPGMLCYIL